MGFAARSARLAVVVALALAASACGDGDGSGTPSISVDGAFVPVPAAANGALYLEIANGGDAADRLIGVSVDAAESAEIHETVTSDNGLTRMESVEEIVVDAGETVVLEPGGMHVMLLGVSDVETGDSIPVVLEFAESGSIELEAEVGAAGASGDHDEHG